MENERENRIYSTLRGKILCKEVPERFNKNIHKSYIPYMLYKARNSINWKDPQTETGLLRELKFSVKLTNSSIRTLGKMFRPFNKEDLSKKPLDKIDSELLKIYGEKNIKTFFSILNSEKDKTRVLKILMSNDNFMYSYFKAGFYLELKTVLISEMRHNTRYEDSDRLLNKYEELIKNFELLDLSEIAQIFYTEIAESSVMVRKVLLEKIPYSGATTIKQGYKQMRSTRFFD